MSWFSKTNEVPDSVKEQWELDRRARAEKAALEEYLRETAAKSERLTRDALRPQVWFTR